MDFDKLKIAKAYTKARGLNPNAKRVWTEAILKYVKPSKIHQILDLGCGTGRFVPFLQELFHPNKIYGIDPSKEMLAEAKNVFVDASVELIEGAAENIPLGDKTVDLVFMVMAYHALENSVQAAKEIFRVLKSEGYLIIKQFTKESRFSPFLVEFFSEFRDITLKLVPSRQALINNFAVLGFTKIGFQTINFPISQTAQEVFERTKARAISVLKMIPDKDFEKGLKEFEEYCKLHGKEDAGMNQRDLFVFQKP